MLTFGAVCLMTVIVSVITSIIWFKEKNIIESAVMGIILFFCTYITGSIALFVIDRFSLFRAICAAFIINIVLLLITVKFRKTKPFTLNSIFRCNMSLKDVLIPVIVALLALPLVSEKNELFGMGQDQGVYQIQAICFMNNNNDRQKDFSEFHKLETQEERESFEYFVKNALRGYDIPNENYPDTVYDRNVSKVSGIIHGIPTFSAMLAMWGTLFGMSNMFGIESLFYVLMIFLIFFVCRNLKLKKGASLCACAVAAAAPVIIWTAKSSLTEMFLTLLPLIFIYFISDEENPNTKWLSVTAIIIFGFYHVSIYTMIPMFFIIYGGLYFFTREKQFAILMPATSLIYLISFFVMKQVQPLYTMNNYSPVFALGIDQHSVTAAVIVFCIALIIASAIYIMLVSKSNKNFDKTSFNQKAAECRWFRILMTMLIILPVVCITVKALFKYDLWDEANHITLLGFIGNAGIIMIPLAMFAAVVFVKHCIEKNSRLVLFLMFFYCILIYSLFLRYELQYYYYYSRYLGPFIPVAVLFAVMILDRFENKLIYPTAIAGLLFVAPYDRYLMNHKDDTRMEWSVLEDIADITSEGDCLLIDRSYMDHLWLPLKNITNADIYPYEDDLENHFRTMSYRYDRILFVTEKQIDSEDFSPLYMNRINHIEDDLTKVGKIIPMSEKFLETIDEIYVYSYDRYQFKYSAAKDYYKFDGVSALEGDFCWTDEENAVIECGLYPDDYNVTLSFGGVVPLQLIGKDSLDVTLIVNGEIVGTETINNENNGKSLSFSINEELIDDGINYIELETEIWNASDVNPADSRTLGIPIKSLSFSAGAN